MTPEEQANNIAEALSIGDPSGLLISREITSAIWVAFYEDDPVEPIKPIPISEDTRIERERNAKIARDYAIHCSNPNTIRIANEIADRILSGK